MMETENQSNQPEKQRGYFFSGLVIGILAAVLIVSAVYLGFKVQGYLDREAGDAGGEGVTVQKTDDESDSLVDQKTIDKLERLEYIIRRFYYKDDEISDEDLIEGAYYGMLEALGDPYSTYYSPEELASLMEQTEGIYYGIGAYVSLDTTTNYPKIVSAIPGTPAEEANLRSDDIIYEVDGVSTYDMSLDSVVAMIKGEEGTKVTLTIYRAGEPDYLHVDVERRRVESPTVSMEMLEDGMAYIQITEFDEVTVDQFADALATARGSGMKGLILDLRANPGGSLSSVVDIAQMLLPKGLIVYTEDKYGNRDEYRCDGKREFDQPMVVLVDGNSASAAEILAGSIQDYGLGTLVGTTTFGKGIVQQIITLSDGSAVKVTVSSYYTPNGRNIHGIGIEPDVVCQFDADAYYDEDYDNQLERAKEVLREMLK